MLLIRWIQGACRVKYLILKQDVLYFMYSKVTQNKIGKLCKRFCKYAKVKLGFTSEKLRQTFTSEDSSYQSVLSSKVVYKFVCASCNPSFVGQTYQHLTTRTGKNFGKDKKSHIYQHFMSSADQLIVWMPVHVIVCYSRYCKNKASVTHKGKFVY